MRRAEGSMSAVAAPGAAGASGGGSRRGSRVGLGRFLVQVADLVGQLRALPDPVVDAGDVPLAALLGARGDRVVETHPLGVAAVARAALVGDDGGVEGGLLGATAGKADLDRGFLVLARRLDGEGRRY